MACYGFGIDAALCLNAALVAGDLLRSLLCAALPLCGRPLMPLAALFATALSSPALDATEASLTRLAARSRDAMTCLERMVFRNGFSP